MYPNPSMISKLIDQNLSKWKEDLIISIMSVEEATKFFSTPLVKRLGSTL